MYNSELKFVYNLELVSVKKHKYKEKNTKMIATETIQTYKPIRFRFFLNLNKMCDICEAGAPNE